MQYESLTYICTSEKYFEHDGPCGLSLTYSTFFA